MKSEKADGAEGGSGGWIIVTRQPQFKNVNREDDHDGQWSPCAGVPALLAHDDDDDDDDRIMMTMTTLWGVSPPDDDHDDHDDDGHLVWGCQPSWPSARGD